MKNVAQRQLCGTHVALGGSCFIQPSQGGDKCRVANELMLVLSLEN